MKKLPDDSFAFYLSLGAGRSYQTVADHYEVDKKTVTNRAVKENWKARLADYEREQRRRAEKKAGETLEAMNDRQLKVLGYIQAKAIETLKSIPLDSAMDAVKAYTLAVEKERLIRGEPTERTAMDIEKRIIEEHDRWLLPAEEEPKTDSTEDEPASGIEGEQVPHGEPTGEAPDAAA